MSARMSPLRQLVRAAASLGVLHIGSMGLTFLVGILLARQLGPSAYGVYALAMAVTAFAGMLTEFGLPLLAMREFASAEARQSWAEARGLVRWADRMILAISAIVLCGFFVAAAFWDFAERSAFLATMIWAILLIPIVAIAKLRGLALLSLGHTFAGQFAVLILRPGLFALALAVMWLAGRELGPAEAMAWQVAAAAAALLTVAGLFLHFRPAAFRAATPVNRWRQWLGATIPMGMTEGLRLLQGQLAVFLLGALLTTEAVGLFRVAEASAAIGLVPITILNVVAAPQFSRLFAEKNISELQRTLSFVTFAIFLSVAAVAIVMSLFARPLLVLAFGDEFAGSSWPLVVLLLGNLAVCCFGPVVTLCNMAGLERHVTISSAIAIIVQLAAAAILIPAMGPAGAAISVIISMLAWNIFLAVTVRRRIGVNPTISAFRIDMVTGFVGNLRALTRSKGRTGKSEIIQ
ncbi:MAG: oligosaccharide flippase family protein [Blastomonas sp.]